jgi:hypothetical protein
MEKKETKICTKCKIEFPKTTKYFLLKSKRKNSKSKMINLFRESCKKCTYKQTSERRISKKCIELGINISDWESYKRNELLKRPIFKLKDENLKGIKRSIRARILRKSRNENFNFTTIQDYYNQCTINRSKSQRKYLYEEEVLNSQIISKSLPDYYIANRLKKKVSEIPKEMIETKRLIIKLKRLTNGK